jgi:integrase/recombinase XerD
LGGDQRLPQAAQWLRLQTDLGLAPLTVEAYGRGLAHYLRFCQEAHIDPVRDARRQHILGWIRTMREQRVRRTEGTDTGLANATMQQRLVAVRLFYDYLVEERLREVNPVGRGQFTPGRAITTRAQRGVLSRLSPLPWIPTDEQWQRILVAAATETRRNRFMFALAYDAGLRREELCGLQTDDIDPAHRTVRVRPETTKSRRERVVPYSASTGTMLVDYLQFRRRLSRDRGSLFLSESRRNSSQPLSLWTWSKVVRSIALRAALPRFSTHTLRHLCLTDLARAGWDLHAIARFAGHRHTTTTLQYVHLSGRDLANRLATGMDQIHSWRVRELSRAFEVSP